MNINWIQPMLFHSPRRFAVGFFCLLAMGMATLPLLSCRQRKDFIPLQGDATGQSYATLIRQITTGPMEGGFKFLVVGDSRSNFIVAQQVFSQMKTENPAFILHTGDLVRMGMLPEYLDYHLPLVHLLDPIPMIPVAGNHEAGPHNNFEGYIAMYGADRFSFDYQACRFVGVNNSDADGLSSADLGFIEHELGKSTIQYKFVILHIPPNIFETSSATPMAEADNKERGFLNNIGYFQQLMTRQKVDCVFLGHDHGFAERVIGNVRYLISGGGGAPLHDQPWLEKVYHYVSVQVTSNSLKYEVVRLENNSWTPPSLIE